MHAKKLLAALAIAGGLGAGFTVGAGTASADPHWHPGPLPPPGHIGHVVHVPPGHIAQWVGIPPGHWDKPWKWVK